MTTVLRHEEYRHVIASNSTFDFPELLFDSIACDLDGEALSPFPSPILYPLGGKQLDNLSNPDLSPLTSPDLTPTPSPPPVSIALPPASYSRIPASYSTPPLSLPIPVPIPTPSTPENHVSKPLTPCPTSQPSAVKKKSVKSAHRKARQHKAQSAWRGKKRIAERDAVTGHYQGRDSTRKKIVDSAKSIVCDWKIEKAAVASTAFVALDNVSKSRRTYTLDQVVGEKSKLKFKLVKWDGREPIALVDASQRVIGTLAGHPDDENWPHLHLQAAEALEIRRRGCEIPKTHRKHRRGAFPALRCGVSHGGGQIEPGNLKNDSLNRKILDELNGLEPFKRLAGFASSVMATWAPKLHRYYSETIDDLHSNHLSLTRIFPSSVFSAVSYNFGLRTVCFKHKDFANLPFGWCAVTALGSFDPTKGGHLILWDLHLAVEFPPGATVLIPSAIVAHSNVSIGKNERRYSFAQYTAGGIFRWVDNNCKTRTTYLSSLSPEQLADDAVKNGARWEYGLSLLRQLGASKKAVAA